jgi:hypothetical protein
VIPVFWWVGFASPCHLFAESKGGGMVSTTESARPYRGAGMSGGKGPSFTRRGGRRPDRF